MRNKHLLFVKLRWWGTYGAQIIIIHIFKTQILSENTCIKQQKNVDVTNEHVNDVTSGNIQNGRKYTFRIQNMNIT